MVIAEDVSPVRRLVEDARASTRARESTRGRGLTRGTLGLDVDSRAQVDADSNKHTTRHHVHRERDADRVLQS